MEPRKMLILADGMFTKNNLEHNHTVNERINHFKNKYGLETDIIDDDTLLNFIGDEPFSKAMISVEKNGPEFFEQSDAIKNSLKGYEIGLFHFNPCTKAMIDSAEDSLKFIGSLRSGAENINVAYAKEKGISVSTTPGRVSEPVADYTVGMMLALNRDIVKYNMHLPDVKWVNSEDLLSDKGILMKDATVGIIGFGIIGRKVASRLQGFGCKIIAYDPYVKQEDVNDLNVEMVELNELMKRSDFVNVHARLVESTKGLVGKEQIDLMKPTAYFINTARAGLVDENALIQALSEKRIRGAALDVFADEPLPVDSPLLKMDRVILTPHCAGAAGDAVTMSLDIMFDEVERYLNNEVLRNKIR